MDYSAKILITLGGLFLIGMVTDMLGQRLRLPRVTLLLVFGIIIGPAALNLLPPHIIAWFPTITNMALAMVGFLLGGKLKFTSLRYSGRLVLGISLAEVMATIGIVSIGLLLVGVPLDISLLLAGIAAATAPAATADVIWELRAKGQFTQTLLGIVAIDDAWALIAFSIILVIVQVSHGQHGVINILLSGAWEFGGAILLGIGLGIPMAYLTGRIRPGEPTFVEAIGVVFICSGIAIWLHVSFLLAAMILGCVVTNRAHHHRRPFHAIEDIERPFMVLFFILAGVALHIKALLATGIIGIAYVLLRLVGRLLGGWGGSVISHADDKFKRWIGLALLPQAGVALGMALVAIETFPKLRDVLLPIVLGATVLFELIGPIFTRIALTRVGEVRKTNLTA